MSKLSPEQAKRFVTQFGDGGSVSPYLVTPTWDQGIYIGTVYEQLWGEPTAEFQADPLTLLDGVHEDDRERVHTAIETVATTEPTTIEFRLDTENDTPQWVSLSAQPIVDEAGTVEAIGGFIRDITDQKEQEQQFEFQRDRLEILNEVVRHDLRNDMQIIRGRAQLLAEYVDPEGEDHLDDILLSVQEAIDTTKTARDLARTVIDEKTTSTQVNITRVVDDVVGTARARHEKAVITVQKPDRDLSVLADDMLKTVVHNLVQNAIIHNNSAMPEITVTITATDDTTVQLEVADNGPGVPADRREEIFGKGEKGLESPGTGLGLYLVQTLIDSYDGTIEVTDNEPQGSIFRVELPRVTAE